MEFLSLISKKRDATYSAKQDRNTLRHLLRKASKGNIHSFGQFTSHYLEFISNYYISLGYIDATLRSEKVKRLLTRSWRYLPYSKRVSDFERFLYSQLQKEEIAKHPSKISQLCHLNELNEKNRFFLAARVLGNWSYKFMSLAARVDKKDLPHSLAQLKSNLIGFNLSMLRPMGKAQIVQVSELLEGRLPQDKARQFEKEISRDHLSRQFKADWLEYRCELINSLLPLKFTQETLDSIIAEVSDEVKQQPMEKPRLIVNLANHISFNRIPGEA